jgi:hypothetical protein
MDWINMKKIKIEFHFILDEISGKITKPKFALDSINTSNGELTRIDKNINVHVGEVLKRILTKYRDGKVEPNKKDIQNLIEILKTHDENLGN